MINEYSNVELKIIKCMCEAYKYGKSQSPRPLEEEKGQGYSNVQKNYAGCTYSIGPYTYLHLQYKG